MPNFRTTYYPIVTYTLFFKDEVLDLTDGNEPIGWENDLPEIKASNDFAGVSNKFSTSLKFTKDARTKILDYYKKYGLEAVIYLERKDIHPRKIEQYQTYKVRLLGQEKKDEKGQLSISVVESDLLTEMKSKWSEKIEIDRLTTLNGTILPPLNKSQVNFSGKEILRVSKWVADTTRNETILHDHTGAGNTRGSFVAFPLEISQNGHEESRTNDENRIGDNSTNRSGSAMLSTCFFSTTSKDRNLQIELTGSFELDKLQTDDLSWYNIRCGLYIYSDDFNFTYKDDTELFFTNDVNKYETGVINISYNGDIKLKRGESIALIWSQVMDGNNTFNSSNLEIKYKNPAANITITEFSSDPPSKSFVLKPYTVVNRLLQIILDRTDNVLKSTIFDEGGIYEHLGLTIGFWVRNFNDKKFEVSLKDVFKNYKIIRFIDVGKVKIGNVEYLTVERKTDYYRHESIITFPYQIKKYKRIVNKRMILSSLTIGYTKGGEKYTDLEGLLEPMGKHEYSFPTKSRENIKVMLSTFSADPTKIELLRRKQKSEYPEQDTDYDKDVIFLDMKKNTFSEVLELKTWQDIYTTKPTGIFSPDTYFNYSLLPKMLFLEHQRELIIGNDKYDKIKYTGGVGSQGAVYDGVEDTGDIDIQTLQPPLYSEELLDFEHDIDFELNNQINGITLKDKMFIPNINYRIEIKNEKGDREFVYLKNLKPKNGKITKSIVVGG